MGKKQIKMEAEDCASTTSLVTLFALGSFIGSLLAKALCHLSGGENDSISCHWNNRVENRYVCLSEIINFEKEKVRWDRVTYNKEDSATKTYPGQKRSL